MELGLEKLPQCGCRLSNDTEEMNGMCHVCEWCIVLHVYYILYEATIRFCVLMV